MSIHRRIISLMGATTGPAAGTITFQDANWDTSNTTSYNFSSSFGSAFAGRILLIGVVYMPQATGTPPNISVTVAGNAATSLSSVNSTGDVQTAIFGIALASGTTGTVNIQSAVTGTRVGMCVYSLANISSITPTHTTTGGAALQNSTQSISIGVNAGGVTMGVAFSNYGGGSTNIRLGGAGLASAGATTISGSVTNASGDVVWTGLTEGNDTLCVDTNTNSNIWYACASLR